MKKIFTKDLLPGMILASEVVTENLNIILDPGTILDEAAIAKLTFYSIYEVEVEDESIYLDPNDPEYVGLTSSERLRRSPEFKSFKHDFELCAHKFENAMKDIVAGNTAIDTDLLLAPVYSLLKKGKTTSDVFIMLNNLRDYDDATYTHCINVALSSNILAQWLRWSDEEIETVTLSGLFHDIGKICIPEEIVTKPGKLNPEELAIMRTHPQKGYDAIKTLDISVHVKNAALMHHERCDGSGYPAKLTAPQIDKFAKIVAIADVYDAMTSARYYRKAMCPFIALQTLEDEGLQKYDAEMIICFLQNIVNTYLQSTVRLNTGEIGEIVFINKTVLAKPTIKIVDDYIDLSKCPGVYIKELL
ncbi:HD-GYP domain-containing protein [Butyrivibrio proteoclasticus]|uniref:HD-GYP domain-containing protein n=1 Tax=Butyrivibrio proteoclasticus TaxID=43305 RepID=UPI00047DEAD5|nr:HD-GYP domain-containing protein [Butyrivibrio proteoclasticus]